VRDRFPLLLVGGLLLLGFAGSFVFRGAARGGFADVLSTYRAEPDGARALYQLTTESGLPVDRLRTDFMILDPRAALALIGVEFAGEDDAKEKLEAVLGKADAGEGVGDQEDDDLRKGLAAFRAERVTADEREKVLEHVKKGNSLVYVLYGARKDPFLEALHVSVWKATGAPGIRTLVPAQPSPFTVGVDHLEAKVNAFLGLPEDGVPLLVDAYTLNIAAAMVPYGKGRVVVIGAPELAMNTALARADNAQFWLSTLAAIAETGTVWIDEYHHGFSDDRSIAEFARRYGLHFAAAQLILGLCLWAGSLRRFGRSVKPPEDERLGATDALFAQSRLYREGKHHAFAASLIAQGLSQELAGVSGQSAHAPPAKIAAALEARGRADLARGLTDVVNGAGAVRSEADLLKVAENAARTRHSLPSKERT
jgi:hypothetical protein